MNTNPNPSQKNFHGDAEEYVNNLVTDYRNKLEVLAEALATKGDDEVVLRNHVKRAERIITNKEKETWLPEVLRIVGGGLFGSGVFAFINEASLASPRSILLITYFTLTLAGIFLLFLGFVIG